jgi:hypothetical protein
MIETDGVSCSILLLRNQVINPTPSDKKDIYLNKSNADHVAGKTLVAADPGKNDLIFWVAKNQNVIREDESRKHTITKLRYTQNQRRKETKLKRFRKRRQTMKEDQVIEEKNVIAWETELSEFSKRTLIFEEFQAFVAKKNQVGAKVFPFYENQLFRKLRLNIFSELFHFRKLFLLLKMKICSMVHICNH